MAGLRFHVLSSALVAREGAPLPTEFLLFNAGQNDTEKGVFTFDALAAEMILSEYTKRGVDLMIDLEHDSLNKEARALRSDAADARGWFGLSLHADGSLWGAGASWTPDGSARLIDKRQRYISPAFATTTDAKGVERPSRLVNAAICARPATYETPALVAASAGVKRGASQQSVLCQALIYTLIAPGNKPRNIPNKATHR